MPGGIKIVRRRMADGTVKEYRYDLSDEARKKHVLAQQGAIGKIAAEYRQDPEFKRLSPMWQSHVRNYLDIIHEHLGWMTFTDLNDRRSRGEFFKLRNAFESVPVKGDKIIGVLRRLLDFAYDRGLIEVNHANKITRLSDPYKSRADKVWLPELEDRFLAAVESDPTLADIGRLFRFLLYTACRLGDAMAMPWSAYDGSWLRFIPSKTRRTTKVRVNLPVSEFPPLSGLLAGLERTSPTILTTSTGKVWQQANVARFWMKTIRLAGLEDEGLHLHDLRGTAVTRMLLAGCSQAEVAAITGHRLPGAGQLSAYAGRSDDLAVSAYRKWAMRPR